MKKALPLLLLTLLLLFLIFTMIACSGDNDEDKMPEGNTTIEVHIEGETRMLFCVAGYKDGDVYKRVCDIGGISENNPSKEIKIKNGITEIYIFGEYGLMPVRIKEPFTIMPDTKNLIVIKNGASKEVSNFANPKEYPVNY